MARRKKRYEDLVDKFDSDEFDPPQDWIDDEPDNRGFGSEHQQSLARLYADPDFLDENI
jgi:hypothetical protein